MLGGHYNIVRLLVEKGAVVIIRCVRCGDRWAPLHFAAGDNRVEITKFLLERGATVDITNGSNQTLLHIAVEKGNSETARILVSSGADYEMKDRSGITPLDLARSKRNNDIVQYLLHPSDNVAQLKELIRVFEGLPACYGAKGRFVVDSNIWRINRDHALLNLREVIRLFKTYNMLINWSGEYYGLFTFGGPKSNDEPGDEGTIACANGSGIGWERNTSLFLCQNSAGCQWNSKGQIGMSGAMFGNCKQYVMNMVMFFSSFFMCICPKPIRITSMIETFCEGKQAVSHKKSQARRTG